MGTDRSRLELAFEIPSRGVAADIHPVLPCLVDSGRYGCAEQKAFAGRLFIQMNVVQAWHRVEGHEAGSIESRGWGLSSRARTRVVVSSRCSDEADVPLALQQDTPIRPFGNLETKDKMQNK